MEGGREGGGLWNLLYYPLCCHLPAVHGDTMDFRCALSRNAGAIVFQARVAGLTLVISTIVSLRSEDNKPCQA